MNPPSAPNSPDLPQALTTLHLKTHNPTRTPSAHKNTCPPDPTGAFPVPFCYRSTIGPLCESWAFVC
jgi:hypothetical protein